MNIFQNYINKLSDKLLNNYFKKNKKYLIQIKRLKQVIFIIKNKKNKV